MTFFLDQIVIRYNLCQSILNGKTSDRMIIKKHLSKLQTKFQLHAQKKYFYDFSFTCCLEI